MPHIVYITYDWWMDTDVDILKAIAGKATVEVFVISICEKDKNKYPDKNLGITGVTVHDFPIWDKNRKLSLALNSAKFAVKAAKAAHKADKVLYMDDSNPVTAWLLSRLLPRERTTVTFHDYEMHVDEPGFKQRIHNLLVNRFRNFHFFSPTQHKAFIADHPNLPSFHTLLPLKDFGPMPEPSPDSSANFLFFGYVRDYKRLDLFIEAARNVKNPRARFTIIGNCTDPAPFRSMIGNDRRFSFEPRFVTNDEIPAIFAGASYLVLPYSDSTESGPALIAINYSKPIIASDQPLFKDLITPGENGYLFPSGNCIALTEVIEKAASLTPEEYSRLITGQEACRDRYNRIATEQLEQI